MTDVPRLARTEYPRSGRLPLVCAWTPALSNVVVLHSRGGAVAGHVDAFMRESDAFSWYMEHDPALRATIVAVAWLDRSPDWGILIDRLERATRLVPIFRQRPVEPPGRLATPRWTIDPDFDLTWHLRRVASPPPHSARHRRRDGPSRGDVRIRFGPSALGVHPRRGPVGRRRSLGDEAPPFAH